MEALGLSTKQRQPPENLRRATTEKDRGEELVPSPTTLRPQQNAIPTQSLFLSFYSPGKEGRYISLHHIYSLFENTPRFPI